MGTKTRISRRASGLLLGLGLLSLVFLGSPGCGCGSDNLGPPQEERPERCCCIFEWLPPSNVVNRDVVVSITNDDASLDAAVTPALLEDVISRRFETFTVCVNEEHLIDDQLELVFTDQLTAVVYGRALLIYSKRCEPIIEPLTPEMNLVSTDCGGEVLTCCCEFEWLPNPNQMGDVNVLAENVSAGLFPTISPNALFGVTSRSSEFFDVCVNADHPLGATLELVVRQQGSSALLGMVILTYDEPCIPTVTFTTAAPTLDITSTECGGDPLICCCVVEWLPGDVGGDVILTTENATAGLTAHLIPTTLIDVQFQEIETFQLCVNSNHPLGATLDLVITTSPGGQEVGRSRVTYAEQCTPTFADIPGTVGLQLTSTECGGDPFQCCCTIRWHAPVATWNPPGGPWTAALENVHGSLEIATIDPTSVDVSLGIPSFIDFEVCVNPTHDTLVGAEIVLRGATGVEFSRVWLLYDLQCQPLIDDTSGEGSWESLCIPN